MASGRRDPAWALMALAGMGMACSGGGGNGGGGGVLLSSVTLSVVGHSPAGDERQVATSSQIRVQLDGPIVSESLMYAESGLFTSGNTSLPGTFTVEDGSTVVFTPQTPMPLASELWFRLSPLTADAAGRLLDRELSFRFHTEDRTPPSVATSSVAAGQAGVSLTPVLSLVFDEDIEPASAHAASVQLRDGSGNLQNATYAVADNQLDVTPVANLAGTTNYTLLLAAGPNGIRDLAGNALASPWSLDFSTAADVTAPATSSGWPASAAAASPLVTPCLYFTESIDPSSIDPNSLQFVDQNGSPVGFAASTNPALDTVQLAPQSPLTVGQTYTVTAVSGANGVEDRSGNTLGQPSSFTFTVGPDSTPPAVASTAPLPGAAAVSLNAQPTISFVEDIDPASLTAANITLTDANGVVPITFSLENNRTVRVVPTALLASGQQHLVSLRGGAWGLRDVAGNVLPNDVVVGFRTADDPTLPTALLFPNDRNASVPRSAMAVAVFDSPMDPATVHSGTVFVTGPNGFTVAATTTLTRDSRVVRIQPLQQWAGGTWYTLTVLGGTAGVREATGNCLAGDLQSQFRTSFSTDQTPPTASVTINGIDTIRTNNLSVPPSGFLFEVSAWDPIDYSLDMSSVEILLSGTGAVPGPEVIFEGTAITPTTAQYAMDEAWALAPGNYSARAKVRDLSGNEVLSVPVDFQVHAIDAGTVPFERTQVVWVRFKMDRNGNGRGDLEDDLLRLGLATAGDPTGTNAFMEQVVRDGILARSHALLGRAATGEALGPDSVGLRLSATQPLGLIHAQIACGGLDPEGNPTRSYGSLSTGTLGRAWYDYRNAQFTESNVASNPGLGVFPGELFLFEARIHEQVYPLFTTSFGNRFLNVCPDMGGTPAGSHPLDPTVLDPSFDYATATVSEQVRYTEVFSAADDWATAIGTILAHEIGHSVGLVADGPNPRGLHGDGSLHNELAGSTDVMASALGYDSLLFLNYGFRDLNIAYLRHRILLR